MSDDMSSMAYQITEPERTAAELQRLRAENEKLRKDVEHWREARRVALFAGDELRAEHAALLKDKLLLRDQMQHIRTHLYAATVQRAPSDDRIIANHVEQAYLRADNVLREIEERE